MAWASMEGVLEDMGGKERARDVVLLQNTLQKAVEKKLEVRTAEFLKLFNFNREVFPIYLLT